MRVRGKGTRDVKGKTSLSVDLLIHNRILAL